MMKLKLQNIESTAAQVFLHIKPTKMIQLPIRIGINQIKKNIDENETERHTWIIYGVRSSTWITYLQAYISLFRIREKYILM